MSQTMSIVGHDGLDHAPGCMFIHKDGIEKCSCDATRREFVTIDGVPQKSWWFRCWERWMQVRVSPSWWARSDGQQPKWPILGADGEDPWVPGVDFDDSPETPPRLLAAMQALRNLHAEETGASIPPALWEFHDDAQKVLEAVDRVGAAEVRRVFQQQQIRLNDCRFNSGAGEEHVRLNTALSALDVLCGNVPGVREYLAVKEQAGL